MTYDCEMYNILALINRQPNLWNQQRFVFRIFAANPYSVPPPFPRDCVDLNLTGLTPTRFKNFKFHTQTILLILFEGRENIVSLRF